MTSFHREYISCPYCLNEEETVVWDQLDACEDPDLKDRLLRKQLQIFDCRNCGRSHVLARPLLYRDENAGLIFWLDPQLQNQETTAQVELPELLNQLQLSNQYKFRIVVSSNELNEKIHIADYNLDDRVMEIVKLAVLAWQKEEIRIVSLYFLSAEKDRLLFMAQGEDEKWYQLPVAADLYHQIELLLDAQIAEDKGWMRIDSAYARPYFDKLG
ncbi:MAG: CpXC domain-containing protein [Eubacteriales bacterium]|nr:CpXC domain-containing protein [Eubacteriales bacterium]MDD4682169.1 CpXC domain-containing protein [Eubacteriales bacterium]